MKARSQRKRGRERDPGRERVGGRGGSLASRVGRCRTSAAAPDRIALTAWPSQACGEGRWDSLEGRATYNSSRRTSQRPGAWIVDREGVSCVTRRDASSEVIGAKPRLHRLALVAAAGCGRFEPQRNTNFKNPMPKLVPSIKL